MSIDVQYRTSATASGGRDGCARTQDGRLDLRLSTPGELGGTGGEGTNPEQLFASGYAACFLGALQFSAYQLKLQVPDDVSVTATVGIGLRTEGGFGLDVDLAIRLHGLAIADARRLAEAAHRTCPYSNATRNNVDVRLTLV